MASHGRPEASASPRPLIHPLKTLLVVAAALVLIAGIQLFVLTHATDTYFAWTIASSMTAAFLGASYLASSLLEAFAASQTVWARARPGLLGVLTFTSLTTLVTLLHLDKFHFGAPAFTASAAAWAWLVVYVAVPPLLVTTLWMQMRSPGEDPPSRNDLPRFVVAGLYGHAALLAPLGLAALVAPEALAPYWPWEITPLTGRAIGAWLIALAVAAVEAADANDAASCRGFGRAYAALGVLQLAALARFGDELRWHAPSAWIYLAVVLSVLAVGVALVRAAEEKVPVGQPSNRA